MNTTTSNLEILINNRGMVGGHAAVRAVSENGEHEAIFVCPGTGDGDHCFRRAEALAKEAGFVPLPAK